MTARRTGHLLTHTLPLLPLLSWRTCKRPLRRKPEPETEAEAKTAESPHPQVHRPNTVTPELRIAAQNDWLHGVCL